ncbi:MAG: hypothetical protein IID43_00385 [Planctomycetes bacterium]|nr:hypothetical protein [Planctomycetota bacterium]
MPCNKPLNLSLCGFPMVLIVIVSIIDCAAGIGPEGAFVSFTINRPRAS